MLDALYTAATGMLAQQTGMDAIANNLANVNTVGFKAGRTAFADLLYSELSPSQAANQGSQMGLGVQVSAIQAQMDQGQAQTTGVPTDVMIDGSGFLQVQRADGSLAYTRAGNLAIDANRTLVTPAGEVVQPRLTIPANGDMNTLSITSTGAVTIQVSGKDTTIGQLKLAIFPNPYGLDNVGGNDFVETPNSGAAQLVDPGASGAGLIRQGMLEMSNVKAVDEMVSMITTQRAYEGVSKVVSASDDMLGVANALRR